MFGSARGAFTGAVADRRGLVETAHGGSLFLDEAGDLPHHAQAKLLRVLDSGEVRRVGAAHARRACFRLIAAVQEEPCALLGDRRWRRDFFYRVNGVVLRVPSLREHREDIGPIARAFLLSRNLPRLDGDALAVLTGRAWPGNVRELQQVLRRATFHAHGATIGLEHVLAAFGDAPPNAAAEHPRSLNEARSHHVRTTVESCNGDTRRAAELLGISRTHVYRLLNSEGRGVAEAG